MFLSFFSMVQARHTALSMLPAPASVCVGLRLRCVALRCVYVLRAPAVSRLKFLHQSLWCRSGFVCRLFVTASAAPAWHGLLTPFRIVSRWLTARSAACCPSTSGRLSEVPAPHHLGSWQSCPSRRCVLPHRPRLMPAYASAPAQPRISVDLLAPQFLVSLSASPGVAPHTASACVCTTRSLFSRLFWSPTHTTWWCLAVPVPPMTVRRGLNAAQRVQFAADSPGRPGRAPVPDAKAVGRRRLELCKA